MGCGSSKPAVFAASQVQWDSGVPDVSSESNYTWVHKPGEESWEGEWRSGDDMSKEMGAASKIYGFEKTAEGLGFDLTDKSGSAVASVTPDAKAKCATIKFAASGRSVYQVVKAEFWAGGYGTIAFDVYKDADQENLSADKLFLRLESNVTEDMWTITSKPGKDLVAKYKISMLSGITDPRTVQAGGGADLQLVLAIVSVVQGWKTFSPPSQFNNVIGMAAEIAEAAGLG